MRILATFDGTRTSELAVGVVAKLAGSTELDVHLLRVIKPGKVHDTASTDGVPPAPPPAGTPTGHLLNVPAHYARTVEDRSQAITRAYEEAEDYLSALAATRLTGVPCSLHVLGGEDVPGTIATAADAVAADWIVMATHGRTGVSEALLGSVAREVTRRAPVPVMLVSEKTAVKGA